MLKNSLTGIPNKIKYPVSPHPSDLICCNAAVNNLNVIQLGHKIYVYTKSKLVVNSEDKWKIIEGWILGKLYSFKEKNKACSSLPKVVFVCLCLYHFTFFLAHENHFK